MNSFRQLLALLTWPLRMLMALPVRLVSAPRRLMGMSLPTRVGVVLFIFLLLVTVIFTIAKLWFRSGEANFNETWMWRFGPYVLVLLIVIPLVVRQAVKLWLEGDVSRYPDIDEAWRMGLKALAEHRIDLTSAPVFLVVGVRDERQAKSLFDASQQTFVVRGAPQGRAALHWYANSDAVFLVCTDASCLGRVSQKGDKLVEAGPSLSPVAKGAAVPLGGTIVAQNFGNEGRETTVAAPMNVPAPSGPSQLAGTMVLSSGNDMSQPTAASGGSAGLSPTEATELTERLAYICRLLQRARQPLCPVNGIMALLPFDLVQRTAADVEIQRAARGDLETLRRALRMRCTVVALMSGMEEEAGFRELVRRVGAERAKAQRFGKGFNVWNEPTPEQVEAVCAHACKAFEDWAYLLFREKDGLTRPGNKKLYALLCKIRTEFRSRLKNIVVAAFADNRSLEATKLDPLLFGGCYFGAIGDTEDRQAFVKSVFDKLIQSEEELEWGQEAIREDDRYHLWTQVLLVVDGLLLIAIGGYAAYLWHLRK